MEKKTIKGINVEVEINGKGIVNGDSYTCQKYLLSKFLPNEFIKNDYNNVLVNKKLFNFDPETGEVESWYYLISNQCIFKNCFHINKSLEEWNCSDEKTANLLVQYPVLLTGYLNTNDQHQAHIYGFHLSDAITPIIKQNQIQVQLCTQSSTNKSEAKNKEKSDTSLYYRETIGNHIYTASGFFDIKELQFKSCDPFYNRLAIPTSLIQNNSSKSEFARAMKTQYPSFFQNGNQAYQYGRFIQKHDNEDDNNLVYNYAEEGVLFTNSFMKYLFHKLMESLLKFQINNGKNGQAKITKLSIQPVYSTFDIGEEIELFKIDDNGNKIYHKDFKNQSYIKEDFHCFYELTNNTFTPSNKDKDKNKGKNKDKKNQ
jgi:hypothetical protein